jgi:hypothetical protein
MGFLSTGLWWAFFVPAALSFTVYTLARRNWQLATSKLKTWGMVCGWICFCVSYSDLRLHWLERWTRSHRWVNPYCTYSSPDDKAHIQT